jgi:hypothetical protein
MKSRLEHPYLSLKTTAWKTTVSGILLSALLGSYVHCRLRVSTCGWRATDERPVREL